MLELVLISILAASTSTSAFCAAPNEHHAKVLRVLDGDTVDFVIDLGFDTMVRRRVRIYGIDTPEIHSRNAVERSRGQEARARLVQLLADKVCIRTSGKPDKYGRVLALVSTPTVPSVAEVLIKEKLGRPYFGTKKEPW